MCIVLFSGYNKHTRHIPKHLLHKIDATCEKENLVKIDNGQLLDIRKLVNRDGKLKKKHYQLAEFRCDSGYKFRRDSSKYMFCSKGKWIGKKPVCEKMGEYE